MPFEISIALFALLISILSFIWNILSRRDLRRRATVYANATALVNIEKHIAEVPSSIRFKGVTDQDLKEAEVSAKELSYLISNFLAGYIHYSADEPKSKEPFGKKDYRYKLLRSEATQKAWPLVKKVLAEGIYSDRIDDTINIIKERNDTIKVNKA